MAEYSAQQMDESLAEEAPAPRPASKPWRRIGLVAAAMGVIGAVVGLTRPRAMTPFQQMHHKTNVFLEAFVERALKNAEGGIQVGGGFSFLEEGVEPNGMQVHGQLAHDGDDTDDTAKVIHFVFRAVKGKGAALKEKLQSLFDAIKDQDHDHHAAGYDLITIANDGDDVEIKFPIDAMNEAIGQPVPAPQIDLDEAVASKPTLDFTFSTGRDFQEIVDHLGSCFYTWPRGVKFELSTQLGEALLHATEKAGLVEAEQIPAAREWLAKNISAGPLGAVTSMDLHTTVRYNKNKLEESCDASQIEQQQQEIQDLKEGMPKYLEDNGLEEVAKHAKDLRQHADYFKSITVTGFSHHYQLKMEFTNVKLAPVIKEFLER